VLDAQLSVVALAGMVTGAGLVVAAVVGPTIPSRTRNHPVELLVVAAPAAMVLVEDAHVRRTPASATGARAPEGRTHAEDDPAERHQARGGGDSPDGAEVRGLLQET
jgi:hypothetical protein